MPDGFAHHRDGRRVDARAARRVTFGILSNMEGNNGLHLRNRGWLRSTLLSCRYIVRYGSMITVEFHLGSNLIFLWISLLGFQVRSNAYVGGWGIIPPIHLKGILPTETQKWSWDLTAVFFESGSPQMGRKWLQQSAMLTKQGKHGGRVQKPFVLRRDLVVFGSIHEFSSPWLFRKMCSQSIVHIRIWGGFRAHCNYNYFGFESKDYLI